MKSIISELEQYDVIGFDLDGTLYDEFDFIKQAYLGVAAAISDFVDADIDKIRNQMIIEWLKVGSSGPVFQNVFHSFGIEEQNEAIIKACIKSYREAPVSLALPDRTKTILDYLHARGKKLYLITDGNRDLQRKKISALGLKAWFSYIAISGDYGKEYQKPSSYMFEQLKERIPEITKSVYCGDRDVDKQFSVIAEIDFLHVKNMCLAQE